MKIYTKTGDRGMTSLVGGKRTLKSDARLNAYGTVDELNSFLGLLRAKSADEDKKALILEIQNTLFTVGASLATDESDEKSQFSFKIEDEKVEKMEKIIDDLQETLPKLTNFIVYGDDELSAICHVCRAVARRAEREIIAVNQEYTVDKNLIAYMNRLSDLLFVLARCYGKNAEGDVFLWKK